MRTIVFLLSFCLWTPAALADNPSRSAQVESYLLQHAASDLKNSNHIYQALTEVFSTLPDDVFTVVTDYKRPVIFLGTYTTTIARYAKSEQFLVTPDDPPGTLSDGIYIIQLADELETFNVEAIKGIIYHELAHRYLEHLLKPTQNCEMEREANRLVKTWGFEQEYLEAKDKLGAKHKGDSRCHDEIKTD